jgi:hypothetical protein
MIGSLLLPSLTPSLSPTPSLTPPPPRFQAGIQKIFNQVCGASIFVLFAQDRFSYSGSFVGSYEF